MKPERRSAFVVNRDVGDHPHGGFVARVLRYGPPADDYNTTWARGVANDGLERRLPVLAWGHSWSEPIGRAVRWWEESDGLYMEFRFDDPTVVPRAAQAREQIRSGTLTDVSIGFIRRDDERNSDGSVNITRADIDEVSIVLRGAVNGAEVLAVRQSSIFSADPTLDAEVAEALKVAERAVERWRRSDAELAQLRREFGLDRRTSQTQIDDDLDAMNRRGRS